METFNEFYNRVFRKLFYYAVRMVGDSEYAADIAQESFARCLQRYGEENRDSALLFAAARNLILDGFRRKKRHDSYLQGYRPESDGGANPIEIMDEYRHVMEGLQQLDEDARDILSMVATSGLSYREIAEMVGITEGNIKVKVHRARARLKEILLDPLPETSAQKRG